MAGDHLILSSEILELRLSPSIGGAISGLACIAGGRRTAVLRESHSPLEKVLDAACFPLVPFSNRIRGGCFSFRGEEIRLEPNMAGDPSPLHGQGWTSPWSVESRTAASAVLALEHEPGEWPWAYAARQSVRVEASALHMRLACRNISDRPMPCGLGFHPYFSCGPDTRIRTGVGHVWTVDELVLPVERLPATGRFSLADDPACGRGLDNGYGGWTGRALFTDPGWPFQVELSSPGARFFQLYSPEHGGLFVAEPVTHANAALNEPEEQWPALGLQVLDPGAEMSVEARLAIQLE